MKKSLRRMRNIATKQQQARRLLREMRKGITKAMRNTATKQQQARIKRS